mgnify:CR=1 FL=1
MGEIEGAMGGLSIAVAGILTVIVAPIFFHISFSAQGVHYASDLTCVDFAEDILDSNGIRLAKSSVLYL